MTKSASSRAAQAQPIDNRTAIIHRLKRASGQLNAVIAGIESETSCTQTITQLAAVSKALDRVGFLIITTSMRTCLKEIDGADATFKDAASTETAQKPSKDVERLDLDQLEKLFLMLA